MGGSSSSAATTDTSTVKDFTFNNVDNRVLDGDGLIEGNLNFNLGEGDLSGNDINITRTTTDFGAISKAFDSNNTTISKAFNFAGDSLETVSDFGLGAIDAIQEQSDESITKLGQFVGDFSKTQSEDLTAKLFTFGTLSVIAFTVFQVLKK